MSGKVLQSYCVTVHVDKGLICFDAGHKSTVLSGSVMWIDRTVVGINVKNVISVQ